MAARRSFGIYIHIPVCSHLCGYCDFFSVLEKDTGSDFWFQYANKIEEEFRFKNRFILPGYTLTSVYFGGGTPTLAPPWFLPRILEFLEKNVAAKSRKLEISIEANPETISPAKVSELHSAGVNRLSMGIQSLQAHLLRTLDRSAGRDAALYAFETVANGPIANWSADLIYGIPGQTSAALTDDIEQVAGFEPAHISAYALTMEQGHIGVKNISITRQAMHHELVADLLPSLGYEQYEISNFYRKNYGRGGQCLHNLSVWKYRPYLSLGTSGHSFLDGHRFRTVADIKRYLERPAAEVVHIDTARPVPDMLITAFRLKTYQGRACFKTNLGQAQFRSFLRVLDIFEKKKWVKVDKSGFILTRDGLNFSNTMQEEAFIEMDS